MDTPNPPGTPQKPARRRRAAAIVAAAALLLAAGAVAGALLLRHHHTQALGVVLTPGANVPARAVNVYLQNDPAWGADSLGGSGYTMAGAGCLVSVVASAMNELGVEADPGALNKAMTEAGGFEDGMLLWYKLNEVYPEVNYRYKRLFSSTDIDADLARGLLPIVKVKMNGLGAQHWLLVVGAADGDYLVIDPLRKDLQPIPLSTHGRVYAYRVLVPAG